MSGVDGQQRDNAGRRGWWLVGLLALSGAVVGAWAGYRLDPDVPELMPSLAAAGFGLGGLIGLVLLAPAGLWRAWRGRARRRAEASERAEPPDASGLWHTADTEPEPPDDAPAETPAGLERPEDVPTGPERPDDLPVEAPTEQETQQAPSEEPEGSPAEAPDPPQQPQREEAQQPALETPEPEALPPPPEEDPGWYPDPTHEGVRRFWDGNAWTGHVWRGREPERTRSGRRRR